jgi:hypothetical protein
VQGPNLAQRNTNVVVRSMACLGGAGAYACESGKIERKPDAKRPTYTQARNPDRSGSPNTSAGNREIPSSLFSFITIPLLNFVATIKPTR